MPRITKAQIAILPDDDLVQRATDAAKLHQELLTKDENDIMTPHERSVMFKERRKLRNLYRTYEEVLLRRYVDATTTRDTEYLNYYRDLVETKIPPLYKMSL